jgi:hypothetical protein
MAAVAVADGLFDLGAHALFPGLHGQRAVVEDRHVGDLADRHVRAVVVHVHGVEQSGARTAGADLDQVGFEGGNGLVHLALHGLCDFGDGGHRGLLSSQA